MKQVIYNIFDYQQNYIFYGVKDTINSDKVIFNDFTTDQICSTQEQKWIDDGDLFSQLKSDYILKAHFNEDSTNRALKFNSVLNLKGDYYTVTMDHNYLNDIYVATSGLYITIASGVEVVVSFCADMLEKSIKKLAPVNGSYSKC